MILAHELSHGFDSSGKSEELTNRFHVTVRLFSNRSQMTSKCGKKKKCSSCVTDVLTIF